jgi:hypothetical protein
MHSTKSPASGCASKSWALTAVSRVFDAEGQVGANVTCAQQRGLACEPLQRGKELGWGAQDEPTVIVSRLAVVLCNMCVPIAIAVAFAVAVAV